jgi:hypothetical protein
MTIAEILRTITDFLLLFNVVGFAMIYKNQKKNIEILEYIAKVKKYTEVLRIKNDSIKAFDEFLDYLHKSGRINAEDWEYNQWRQKFINKIDKDIIE